MNTVVGSGVYLLVKDHLGQVSSQWEGRVSFCPSLYDNLSLSSSPERWDTGGIVSHSKLN